MLMPSYTLSTDSPITIEIGSTAIQILRTSQQGINLELLPPFIRHMEIAYKGWCHEESKGDDTLLAYHRSLWIRYWVRFHLLDPVPPA
jgi:hypothetical protein